MVVSVCLSVNTKYESDGSYMVDKLSHVICKRSLTSMKPRQL